MAANQVDGSQVMGGMPIQAHSSVDAGGETDGKKSQGKEAGASERPVRKRNANTKVGAKKAGRKANAEGRNSK